MSSLANAFGVPAETVMGLLAALGSGLLIGLERERNKGSGRHREPAGLRTFTLVALAMRGFAGLRPTFAYWKQGLAGGAMSCGAYGIAIWAMTVAPIPLVAAVRETSVLFGAAIAVVFLKEPLRANRMIAAVLIVAGLTLIRLQ